MAQLVDENEHTENEKKRQNSGQKLNLRLSILPPCQGYGESADALGARRRNPWATLSE